ncbi:hypothetical protein P170DRAFT_442264 [Aspergillus steynii IBT 23096]|uniref:FAD-dependent urate hydroxylase HpyO/Asp monooxygenase CreE-like FAD/NAD(P)-binding domain-containing protein n=1 Tax=Aspergillus steynii IBT 23096 TaxID=1392250 RepID=A0A2I2GMI7_9EURO|nr:uncharacterized protein P170DRAFT_442264 [Aspergillus steynii IBT 23096]PLB54108.1 hypothetical protein P170DRAFT_442264 [Aspergillus steynii IBT 23096]
MRYTIPSTPSATHVHAAIVGMGPRGTSTLERLCASATEFLSPGMRLTVHVVDPSPPGAGRVWRTEQSSELLMNTVTSQVTLYTDESIICSGPIQNGPSLYEWAAQEKLDLGSDEYPTRAQYGHYLQWVFSEVVRTAPPQVEIEVHAARAVQLDDAREDSEGRQTLKLSNGRILSGLSAVILSQGHVPLVHDPKLLQLSAYATQHGLRYITPVNPADVDLSTIQPGEPVFLRGLGLNFFDYMSLLTTGRGGRFVRTTSGSRYHPSGREPRLFAGSRRGIPYQARGDNEKGPYGRHMPLLLTDELIEGFRQRAESGSHPPDFLKEIWPLVCKEVELVYYEALLRQHKLKTRDFRPRFLATKHQSVEEGDVLTDFGISEEHRWSWERISRPYGERRFTAGAWRDWLLEYLREDAREAALGNVNGPLKAALDVMRDLRNELRLVVDHAGVSGTSHRDHLDRWYTPLNAYVSIGPPRQRIEQMVALIEAGVLEVLGPRPSVTAQDGAWTVHSPEVPGLKARVTTLIEARLPEPDVRHTGDELMAHMLQNGQCRPYTVDGYETGGLAVTKSPYQVVDAQGRAHARRFAVGVPTEGVHWVTAAGARPGVNSVTLCDTDAVGRAALSVAVADIGLAERLADSKAQNTQVACY